ncbi:hypothetical protein Daura_32460 [Dactylosporangium aurantiacum]|uniref:Uncharacterized protein n=1 Tax=Dactylosporangium aurantiacum TaxID=35754 RepID=A0A9Q9IDZ6_9ACTN|nr:hypothetical protein [Dactylosporangium aurantiacum]MDG6107154.1 hypothetical protein [Dactylosporangium aurantiacum]UWZ51448.1 hypothetical protein Daura_32460 [Dactylosporangium aurantiacum]
MRDENFQQAPFGSGQASQAQQTPGAQQTGTGPQPTGPQPTGPEGRGGGYPEGTPAQGGYPEGAPQGGYPEGAPPQGGHPEGAPAQGGYPEGTPQSAYPETGQAQEQAIWDAAEADRIRQRWHEVQTHFVEDPRGSVTEARQLVDDAVQSLAGCVRQREEQLEHAGARSSDSTEGMRDTVLQYHQLLDRLLTV